MLSSNVLLFILLNFSADLKIYKLYQYVFIGAYLDSYLSEVLCPLTGGRDVTLRGTLITLDQGREMLAQGVPYLACILVSQLYGIHYQTLLENYLKHYFDPR